MSNLTGRLRGETVVIQIGRQILPNHKLDPQLVAHAVRLFRRQGALELALTMGDYILAGIMLITADHQLPADRPPLLPTC